CRRDRGAAPGPRRPRRPARPAVDRRVRERGPASRLGRRLAGRPGPTGRRDAHPGQWAVSSAPTAGDRSPVTDPIPDASTPTAVSTTPRADGLPTRDAGAAPAAISAA